MKILLAEDEQKLASALSYLFKKNGYGVDIANDGETAMELAATGLYDLVVLDRVLPRLDGLSVLKEFRALGYDTPVIFLTALDSPQDRVEGLDSGADDYMVKPFSSNELLARLRALSRRAAPQEAKETVAVAGIVLDPSRSEVKFGRVAIKLTIKESLILELLMRNYGHVISTDHILENVWGENSTVYRPYVHLYIHYLRKKLPSLHLKTIHDVGYSLQ
jgi:DNA-binding response OmpR family regulator